MADLGIGIIKPFNMQKKSAVGKFILSKIVYNNKVKSAVGKFILSKIIYNNKIKAADSKMSRIIDYYAKLSNVTVIRQYWG